MKQSPTLFPLARPRAKSEFWITPKPLYESLNDEFAFDFDPCPYPRPPGYNSLDKPWGKMNYVNPPFRKADGPFGGPTAFARKAIEEKDKGNRSVLLLPVQSYVNLLLDAGARVRPLGRVKWLNGVSGQEVKDPSTVCIFVL
ncbi:hypothetical protein ES703_49559 [subsurface metagenome]